MEKDLEYYMSLPYRVEIVPEEEEGVSMNQYCLYLLSKGAQ